MLSSKIHNLKQCCSSSKPSYICALKLNVNSAKHLFLSSHCTLDVNNDGVTDQLSQLLVAFSRHEWLLHLRRARLLHQSCQRRERLLLLDNREKKETDTESSFWFVAWKKQDLWINLHNNWVVSPYMLPCCSICCKTKQQKWFFLGTCQCQITPLDGTVT